MERTRMPTSPEGDCCIPGASDPFRLVAPAVRAEILAITHEDTFLKSTAGRAVRGMPRGCAKDLARGHAWASVRPCQSVADAFNLMSILEFSNAFEAVNLLRSSKNGIQFHRFSFRCVACRWHDGALRTQ